MSKERIGQYITTLSDAVMAKIAEASLLATSAVSFLSPESLVSLWERACLLNAT
jgi:hypothetical protein